MKTLPLALHASMELLKPSSRAGALKNAARPRIEVETEEFRGNMRHVPRRWREKTLYQTKTIKPR